MNRVGDEIHKNTVRRYMREMGLMAIYPGPNLSKRDLQRRIYPYLLRKLLITQPDQVWSVDITVWNACRFFLQTCPSSAVRRSEPKRR
jgi:putative transposase